MLERLRVPSSLYTSVESTGAFHDSPSIVLKYPLSSNSCNLSLSPPVRRIKSSLLYVAPPREVYTLSKGFVSTGAASGLNVLPSSLTNLVLGSAISTSKSVPVRSVPPVVVSFSSSTIGFIGGAACSSPPSPPPPPPSPSFSRVPSFVASASPPSYSPSAKPISTSSSCSSLGVFSGFGSGAGALFLAPIPLPSPALPEPELDEVPPPGVP